MPLHAGNYHARRRWILFRELLDTLGFDLRRIHFTWISAAEGQEVAAGRSPSITEQTRQAGAVHRTVCNGDRRPRRCQRPRAARSVETKTLAAEHELRERCRKLLAEGTVKVVIGYGARGPVMVTASGRRGPPGLEQPLHQQSTDLLEAQGGQSAWASPRSW